MVKVTYRVTGIHKDGSNFEDVRSQEFISYRIALEEISRWNRNGNTMPYRWQYVPIKVEYR